MKLVFFDDFKLGVVNGGNVVDVGAAVSGIVHTSPQDLINQVIANFSQHRAAIQSAADSGQGKPLDQVRLRSPLPAPGNIVCMAVNYMEDGTLPAPAPINAFHKASNTVIGDGDSMVLTDIPAGIFEGEAELGVVIGKRASHVREADAMDYIFGYVNFIDGSARGIPPDTNVFFQAKSRDTFSPIGPFLVTADEVDDPQKLQIQLWVNGDLMQNFNTDDMAHKIPRLVEWTSSIHTLEPGDIIASGTNHGGLNPFQDGDLVELEIEGMGRLRINIRDDLKRTWARITRRQHTESGLEGRFTPQLTGKYAPGN